MGPQAVAAPATAGGQADDDQRPAAACQGVLQYATHHSAVRPRYQTSFDAGVPLRDVQEAASHADPRTTMRYDRARGSLDRHATYIVAAYVAGAAR